MRRIAVINQKGGIGKTTTTANLGAALARTGSRVLLVDLDPQAHLSLHFGVELTEEQPSIYDVLASGTPLEEVAVRRGEHVTLVPADIDLAGAEAELVAVTGREVLLREALERIVDPYDYLLIDCPPSLGVLTINALVAVEEVIIPLQAHFLALQGLGRLLDTVTLVRRRINPELKVTGIVLCMHDSGTRLAGEVVDDLTGFLKNAQGTGVAWAAARLYQTCIRRNIKLAESSSFGQTVFEYAPRSNGAIDYAQLAVEAFGRGDTAEPSVREPDEPSGSSNAAEGRAADSPALHAEPKPAVPGPSTSTEHDQRSAPVDAKTAFTIEPRRPSAVPSVP